MTDDFRPEPATEAKMAALKEFTISEFLRERPGHAHGWLSGKYWYFEVIGSIWTFEIGGNSKFSEPPVWWMQEDRQCEDGAAGIVTDVEATSYILRAIEVYLSEERVIPTPHEVGYADHLLHAWSAGLISIKKVGEYTGLDVFEIMDIAREKRLPIPWTAAYEVERYIKQVEAQYGPPKE